MEKIHYIKSYVKFFFCARHFRGDGVHSPFVFSLINNVFREQYSYYIYNNVETQRNLYLNNQNLISIQDFGTGKSTQTKISDIAKRSLKNKKYSQLLFRIANQAKPNVTLELGTSFGLTTMYLASQNTKARCITIEGAPEIHKIASRLFEEKKINNIEAHCCNIDENLSLILSQLTEIDFVFFDANHTEKATIDYFNQCISKASDKCVFVFDDIYWSKGMTNAWKFIKKHPRVRVSIDIFEMGIIYFNTDLQKGAYTLRF